MKDKEKRELKDGIISIFKRFNILDKTATIGGLKDNILKYISSLQEENVNNDLEKNIEKEVIDWWNEYYGGIKKNYTFEGYTGHYMENFTIISLAKHFYELGLKYKGE